MPSLVPGEESHVAASAAAAADLTGFVSSCGKEGLGLYRVEGRS